MTVAGPRRRMRAEDRREQILDITHAIVDEEGFEAASPKRVAEAAGITRPVLYQQFGDMGGLFVALLERELERARDQVIGLVAPEAEGETEGELFVAVLRAMLGAMAEAPARWRLFLLTPKGAPSVLHERLAASDELVRQFFQEALAAAYPDLKDPEMSSVMIQAAGRELLRLRMTDPERATDDRLAAAVADLVALAARGSEAPSAS